MCGICTVNNNLQMKIKFKFNLEPRELTTNHAINHLQALNSVLFLLWHRTDGTNPSKTLCCVSGMVSRRNEKFGLFRKVTQINNKWKRAVLEKSNLKKNLIFYSSQF